MKVIFLHIVCLFFLLLSTRYAYANALAVITLDAHGFSPKTLEIPPGTTVVFDNKDNVAHWPASNLHPTHSIYPEFDPKKGIEPGKDWSFTFQKAGEWKYHDHLNPSLTGIIIVVGENKSSQDVKKDLFDFADIKPRLLKIYYALFPQKLNRVLEKTNMHNVSKDEKELRYWLIILGGKKFMQQLVHDSGGGSIVDCHTQAHKAGRTAYQLFGAEVFKQGDSGCHSGFYHGAMEAFLKERGTDDLAKKIDTLCKSFQTDFGIFECLHGVGHGITAYEDYDIPAALQLCRKLTTTFKQRSCFGGVFMENIVTAQGNGAKADHNTTWVNMDPNFPCSGVNQDKNIQYECYKMQTTRMLDLLNRDFSAVSSVCSKAPKDMIETCFQSLGRDAAGYTLRDPNKIIAICKLVPSEYFDTCITGAFNVIVDFWGESMEIKPHALCKIVPQESKKSCYTLLGYRLKNVFGNNTQRIREGCKSVEEAYKSVCLESSK